MGPMMKKIHVWSLLLAFVLFVVGCASVSTSRQGQAHATPPIKTPEDLIAATAQLAGTDITRLNPEYVWTTLGDRDQDQQVETAFNQALMDGTLKSRLALIRVLELKFVHDPKTSALDLLGPELSEHFRNFDWQYGDFPGGPPGPNEQFADVMVDVLDLVCPERRANQSRNAVVLRSEATPTVWYYITNQWVSVPGQEKWKLNRHACDSFVRMREQATADGVDLIILSAHRYPEVARANAARARNPNAVASFSSHSLGLAIDFEMSHRDDIHFKELTTRPMSELVRMRESPVHKWLVLYAHKFGWYPYQNEPWHWEYNPPGFHEVFWADFPGGAPKRNLMAVKSASGG
jgi:hypothetical protein